MSSRREERDGRREDSRRRGGGDGTRHRPRWRFGRLRLRLHDVSVETLQSAGKSIEAEMREAVERDRLDEGEMREGLGRITMTEDLEEAASGADLVVEAVLERMDLKLDLFGKLDEMCPEHTILATNTSTMSPTEIAAGTNRSDRCVAMHFFNPAHKR